MTSQFVNRGDYYTIADSTSLDIYPKLPAGTYTIGFNPDIGFMIQRVQKVSDTPKVYGNLNRLRDRILSTFKSRTSNTGVLLEGLKGSGKTMLARMISLQGLEIDMPTLIINTAFKGDAFNKFMQSINQEAVVLFDEFEKVYDEEDQEAILTLLDGVYSSKKLFILTCNDTWRIDQNMKNRPGRLFYRIKFEGLEPDAIKEYCQENLVNKDHLESVLNVTAVFDHFNFDMLKALVEEMNRYDEPAAAVLKIMNIYPDGGSDVYDCVASYKGTDLVSEDVQVLGSRGNPLTEEHVHVRMRFPEGEEVSDNGGKGVSGNRLPRPLQKLSLSIGASMEDETESDGNEPVSRKWSTFKVSTVAPVSVKEGILVFKVSDDLFIRFTRRIGKSFNFDAL